MGSHRFRLSAVGLCAVLLFAATEGSESVIPGTQVRPVAVSVVRFSDIARQPQSLSGGGPLQTVVPFLTIDEETGGTISRGDVPPSLVPEAGESDVLAPLIASPTPIMTFQALPDSFAVGTTTSYIPPDTHGAVGLSKIMVTLNNNVRIQDKATGAPVSTVSLNSFWASTGATGCFDPKVLYDPYNSRWIFTALSNAQSSSSSVLLGVSATSDPSGTWYLSRTVAGSASRWADFPCIGFNKNWLAVSVNMFNMAGAFQDGQCYAFDYPTARGGTFSATLFSGITSANGGFCLHPAVTYSTTQDTLWLASHLSSAGATYKISRLTGTPAVPSLTIGATKVNPLGAWVQPSGDILPQAPEPSPGTGTRGVDVGDAQFRSRVLYRNDGIYYSQTIGLPSTGLTHTAVQWVRVTTAGDFAEGGRVEDPTATSTNGGKWYAYSSVEVNSLNDVLLGFSQFSSAQWPSAGYTFKARGDAAGSMRDPHIYKAGLDYYEKTFSGTRNRWGDFSATQTDPSDEYHLWTIQEYAQVRVGTGNGSGRWDTWWAKVQPVDPLPIQLISFTATPFKDDAMHLEWSTATELNNYGFEVQRAVEGTEGYQTVPEGFVAGHGTTNVPHTYSFQDRHVPPAPVTYRLKQIDLDGSVYYYCPGDLGTPTGLQGTSEPLAFTLDQNYPNPFNPSTRISFTLPVKSPVRLTVVNILGDVVRELHDGDLPAGRHQVVFDAKGLASGVYLCRIEAGGFKDVRKMVLLR